MVLPTLAQRLRAGSTVLSSWSCIPEALTVEAISRLGFEAITLDMQHGGHSDDSVIRSLGAIDRRVCHPVVRIPVGRFDMASRALDFGAEAVIAPMINNVEDARAFAKATKYPPLGQRSWGPVFAMPRAGASDGQEWLKQQNHETIAYAMIETREAYEAVDDILAVDGIDGVFVGPADFSIAWSAGQKLDPSLNDMMEAIEQIAAKAAKAGKLAALYCPDPREVGRYHRMGYRFFALGSDFGYLARGAESFIATAHGSIR